MNNSSVNSGEKTRERLSGHNAIMQIINTWVMKKRFEFGEFVVDTISGFSGKIVSRCETITGCDRYEVQPKATDGGTKMSESVWFDVDRLEAYSPAL